MTNIKKDERMVAPANNKNDAATLKTKNDTVLNRKAVPVKDINSLEKPALLVNLNESTDDNTDNSNPIYNVERQTTFEEDFYDIFKSILMVEKRDLKKLIKTISTRYGIRKFSVKGKIYRLYKKRYRELRKVLKKQGVESITDTELEALSIMMNSKSMKIFYERLGRAGSAVAVFGVLLFL